MHDIILREIRRTDLLAINRWRADQETIGQLGSPFRHVGPETDDRWFENYLATRANNVRLAICLTDGSDAEQLVGVVYLLGIDWINRSTEFAIWLGETSARGKKVGETATRLALKHAFEDLNLNRIHLTVLTDNEPALQLYKKVGFVAEGTFRKAVYKQGRYRDLTAMAILRD